MKTKQDKGHMKISIRFGIASAFVILSIVTTVVLSGFIFMALKSMLREDLRKQLHNSVAVGGLLLNARDQEQILSDADPGTELYLFNRKILQDIRDRSLNIRYVYTMKMVSDKGFVFICDAEAGEDASLPGDVYNEPTRQMVTCATTGEIAIEQKITTDEWGSWMSGFAPIKDESGKTTAILGIDISAKDILANEMNSLLILITISGFVTLFVILIGLFMSRRIITPLKHLEKEMGYIEKFDLDERTRIRTIFREISSMNTSLDDMKKSLRSFKKYVPADLVAELMTLHKEAVPGGETRNMTVLFSDIENYTSLTEKMDTNELIEITAEYFTAITETILEHKGTVDKYIGDCVMAFWGAPQPLEQHAGKACASALRSAQALTTLNQGLADLGLTQIRTRIGINTGNMLVGNFGYEQRLNYTVIGDSVNTASRLEGLNKYYKTSIIVSEQTRDQAGDGFLFRILDSVVVKGKTEQTKIFELVAFEEEASDKIRNIASLCETAFGNYARRDFAAALAGYREVLAKKADDYPALLMAERCQKYIATPPPADWKGCVYLRDK